MLLDLAMEQSVPVVAVLQPSYQKRRSGEGEGREVRGLRESGGKGEEGEG